MILKSMKMILQKRNTHLLVLVFIVAVGIFLRTYKFHDWLNFEKDQVRDATVVQKVVKGENGWPLLGPTMRASSESKAALFSVGPVYYHFQIISAKIFGMSEESMAYPDLFFGILVVPLLFYFFNKFFSKNISLSLAGLYAISFFAIRYARFAWNPNPIPFFAILFLLSLYEFVIEREKTNWFWVAAGGISFGIGIQLHATMLLLFCITGAIVAAYLLKKNIQIWKKLLFVFLIALAVNTPQIVSEYQTNFKNSKYLFSFSGKNGNPIKMSFFDIIKDSASCQIEANAYILSSIGKKDCNYSYVKMFEDSKSGKAFRGEVSWVGMILAFLIFISGYFLFFQKLFYGHEKRKRILLGICFLYSSVFFIIMLPIIGAGFKEFRYFGPIFFMPFLLIGLIAEFLIGKKEKKYLMIFAMISVLFVLGNFNSIYSACSTLAAQQGNDGHAVFLGEVENAVDCMMRNANEKRDIYLMTEDIYSGNIVRPAVFVGKEKGVSIIRAGGKKKIPEDSPLFYMGKNRDDEIKTEVGGLRVKNFCHLGGVILYQLEH